MKQSVRLNNTHRIRQIVICLCLFILLLLPNIYAMMRATDLSYSFGKGAAYLFVSALIVVLPSVVLRKRAFFIVAGMLVLLPAPIEIASLYLYQMPTTQTFLKVIIDTNLREAMEMMSSLWVVALVVLLLWGAYIYLVCQLDNDYLLPKLVRLCLVAAVPIVFAVGVGAMFVLTARTADRLGGSALSLATEKVVMKFRKIYPTDIYIVLADNIRQEREIAQWNAQMKDFSFNIEIEGYGNIKPDGDRNIEPNGGRNIKPEGDGQIDDMGAVKEEEGHGEKEAGSYRDDDGLLVVLVIGEAARASSMSLNGYERETTPCLASQQNLISYTNAYSLTNITETSVPLMLTRATLSTMPLAYQEKSVVEAFSEAGYATAWLTNKTPFAYTSRIIEQTDYPFVNSRSSDAANNYDTLLWRPFKQFLYYDEGVGSKQNRKMAVVHHTGSHFKYTLRYPEGFEMFRPTFDMSEGYQIVNPQNAERLRNAYDNTILFTDFFLSGLIDMLKDTSRPAVLIYMSDHGENLYDDDQQLVLHCTYAGSVEEFHVPLLVWYSDEYAVRYGSKVEALRKNKENMVSSDVLFHTLLDLSDIKTPFKDRRYSLGSDSLLVQDSIVCKTASGAEFICHTF